MLRYDSLFNALEQDDDPPLRMGRRVSVGPHPVKH